MRTLLERGVVGVLTLCSLLPHVCVYGWSNPAIASVRDWFMGPSDCFEKGPRGWTLREVASQSPWPYSTLLDRMSPWPYSTLLDWMLREEEASGGILRAQSPWPSSTEAEQPEAEELSEPEAECPEAEQPEAGELSEPEAECLCLCLYIIYSAFILFCSLLHDACILLCSLLHDAFRLFRSLLHDADSGSYHSDSGSDSGDEDSEPGQGCAAGGDVTAATEAEEIAPTAEAAAVRRVRRRMGGSPGILGIRRATGSVLWE